MRVYVHKQTIPATTWSIVHNLECKPVIDVWIEYQGKQEKVLPGKIMSSDDNHVVITFSAPRTGAARLVGTAPPLFNGVAVL